MPPPELDEAMAPKSLLRRIMRGKNQRVKSVQWTAKLADLADQGLSSDFPRSGAQSGNVGKEQAGTICGDSISVSLRLEGPYFYPADPYRYDTVVCMVAGTGVSGAFAIASAFIHSVAAAGQATSASDKAEYPSGDRQLRRWRRCIIIWSVRESEDIDVPMPFSCEGLEMRKFLTGPGRGRVDLERELEEAAGYKQEEIEGKEKENKAWVYISGPKPFITVGKEACKAVQRKREIKKGEGIGIGDLDFYAASWDP